MWKKYVAVMTATVLLMGSVPVTAHAISADKTGNAGTLQKIMTDTSVSGNEDGTVSGNGTSADEKIPGTYLPYEGAKYRLEYSVEENGIIITGITDSDGKEMGWDPLKRPDLGQLVIPDEIDGVPVTEIGRAAFWNRNFSGNLVIPESVTAIGNSAFGANENLTGELVLPQGLTVIEPWAFNSCYGLTGNLVIPEGVTTIGERAFEYCRGFTGELKIPAGVTSIEEAAFLGCYGFSGSLVIPDSVIYIGDDAFSDCRGLSELPLYQTKYSLKYSIQEDGILITGIKNYKSREDLGELVIPDEIDGVPVTAIGEYAFWGCSGFTGSLDIPESVTEIDEAAFMGCSGFTGSLDIPVNVVKIGKYAFHGCSGLNGSLSIPEGIVEIEEATFSGCSGFIGNLVIPESVTKIGDYAFSGCSSFDGSLTISQNVTAIGDYAFKHCSGFIGDLILPEKTEVIGKYAFNECNGFTGNIVIPDSVTEVHDYAFSISADRMYKITLWGTDTEIAPVALGYNRLIYGYRGSTAETYARENYCTFIPLVPEEENLVQVVTPGMDTVVDIPMTGEERQEILEGVLEGQGLSGTTEGAELEVSVSETELPEADKQAVDDCAAAEGMTPGQYLDISMILQQIGAGKHQITHTNKLIKFVIEIVQGLQQENRKFSIIRLHDGKAEILEDLDDNPFTITIETDRFSSYTLAYRDTDGDGSITGTVTSFGDESAGVTLILQDGDGKTVARTTATGNSAAYTLDGMADGTYTLQISKAGHTTREYAVTVMDGQATQDVELWLIGDVDGSGSINAKDKKMLFEHMSGTPLAGYAFLVGDVDSSGSINAKDKKMLFNHMEGTEKLW